MTVFDKTLSALKDSGDAPLSLDLEKTEYRWCPKAKEPAYGQLENVAQTTLVSGEVAKDIAEVNQAAHEMADSSSQVNESSEELSSLAEQLLEAVGKFKV